MTRATRDKRIPVHKSLRKTAFGVGLDDVVLSKIDKAITRWQKEALNPFSCSGSDQLAWKRGHITPTMIAACQRSNPGIPHSKIKARLALSRVYLKLVHSLEHYRNLQQPRREFSLREDFRPYVITVVGEDGKPQPLRLDRFIEERPAPLASGTRFMSSGRGGKRLILSGTLLAKITQEAVAQEDFCRTEAARKAKRVRGSVPK